MFGRRPNKFHQVCTRNQQKNKKIKIFEEPRFFIIFSSPPGAVAPGVCSGCFGVVYEPFRMIPDPGILVVIPSNLSKKVDFAGFRAGGSMTRCLGGPVVATETFGRPPNRPLVTGWGPGCGGGAKEGDEGSSTSTRLLKRCQPSGMREFVHQTRF